MTSIGNRPPLVNGEISQARSASQPLVLKKTEIFTHEGKTRLRVQDAVAQTDPKAHSIAVLKFKDLSVFQQVGYRLSHRHVLTKVDGQKVFINLKSFEQRMTVSKSLLVGTCKLNKEGFSKGELTKAILSLQSSPTDVAGKIQALEIQKRTLYDRVMTGPMPHTYHVTKNAEGNVQAAKLKTLGEGSFGKVSKTKSGDVIKQSKIQKDEKSTGSSKQSVEDEYHMSSKIHSKFERKFPGEKIVGIGAKPTAAVVISSGIKSEHSKAGFIIKEYEQDMYFAKIDPLSDESQMIRFGSFKYRRSAEKTRMLQDPDLQKVRQDNLFNMYQLLKGIATLEKLGIAHRDIKPENIMYENGNAYLIDFGLAEDLSVEKSVHLQGTPLYMPMDELTAYQTKERYLRSHSAATSMLERYSDPAQVPEDEKGKYEAAKKLVDNLDQAKSLVEKHRIAPESCTPEDLKKLPSAQALVQKYDPSGYTDESRSTFISKTDTFALGLTFYELLTGGIPRYPTIKVLNTAGESISQHDFTQPNERSALVNDLYGSEVFDILRSMSAQSHSERLTPQEAFTQFKSAIANDAALMARIEKYEKE